MKNIQPKIIELLQEGNCTPKLSEIAKNLKEPLATIHYNVKKIEEEKLISTYKAIFNYKKISLGHCNFVFISLSEENYANPEKIANELAKEVNVESVDICTGEQELLVKLRTKDVDEYYKTIKDWTKKYNFKKVNVITSLKQIKSEFVKIE